MKSHLSKFVCGLAMFLAVSATVNASPILTQNGSDPAPSIQGSGGWDGGFVNLTQEVNSQNNQAAFPQVVSGAYSQLKIDFDFRISEGNGGGADGIGFAYVDSSVYGTDGAVPAFSEEVNIGDSFGVGFDTFNNGADDADSESSVSLHYNGALQAVFGLDDSPIGIFENGEVHHAQILVTPSGTGSNVTVTISEVSEETQNSITAVDNAFIEGLMPFDGRMVFNARTGGANSQQDIDNVQLMHMTGGNSPMTTVLYTFVPEPSSISMLLIGSFLLCGARRRR